MAGREGVLAAVLDEAVLVAVLAVLGYALYAVGVPLYALAPLLALVGFLVLALLKGVEAQLRRPLVGAEALVGETGVVVEAGEDYCVVRVGGELWRARLAEGEGCGSVGAGARVVVVGVEGLTLVVRLAEG